MKSTPTFVFRADASWQIGSGHVMRCLTLADELSRHGAAIMFVTREFRGHMNDFIQSNGYQVAKLQPASADYRAASADLVHASWLGVSWEEDAADTITALGGNFPSWLIVDHYALDRRWEETLRPHVGKIMVIDDLADRPHDCELLLDQNLYRNFGSRYDGLLPDRCIRYLGPTYALIRPEFLAVRRNVRQRDGIVRRILVFFGGSDPSNETAKVLEAISLLGRPDIAVDVVVGGTNPRRDKIEQLCDSLPVAEFHYQVTNMAELMVAADLAIGAGGSSTWERCFVGLPAIVLVIAQNQAATIRTLAEEGAVWELGYSVDVLVEDLVAAIRQAFNNPLELKKMGEKAMRIMGEEMNNGLSPLVDSLLEMLSGES